MTIVVKGEVLKEFFTTVIEKAEARMKDKLDEMAGVATTEDAKFRLLTARMMATLTGLAMRLEVDEALDGPAADQLAESLVEVV